MAFLAWRLGRSDLKNTSQKESIMPKQTISKIFDNRSQHTVVIYSKIHELVHGEAKEKNMPFSVKSGTKIAKTWGPLDPNITTKLQITWELENGGFRTKLIDLTADSRVEDYTTYAINDDFSVEKL